jgi:hypothetical protein
MSHLLRSILNSLQEILKIPDTKFSGSEKYWQNRYKSHGNSGAGSYNQLAEFKAVILNRFVDDNKVSTIIEYGSGDGNQLKLAKYPVYLGLDVSQDALERCRSIFLDDSTKRFGFTTDYSDETAELTLSLDVIYHLIEDDVFSKYMERLFASSKKYVIIYASNTDEQRSEQSPHVRHRCFTDWIKIYKPDWKIIQHIKNIYPYSGDDRTGSFADFYIFQINPILCNGKSVDAN